MDVWWENTRLADECKKKPSVLKERKGKWWDQIRTHSASWAHLLKVQSDRGQEGSWRKRQTYRFSKSMQFSKLLFIDFRFIKQSNFYISPMLYTPCSLLMIYGLSCKGKTFSYKLDDSTEVFSIACLTLNKWQLSQLLGRWSRNPKMRRNTPDKTWKLEFGKRH